MRPWRSEQTDSENLSDTWHVYVLRCADGSLYCGVTTDLERRLQEHNASPRGAKYTRSRRPVALVASAQFDSKSAAFRAEYLFKSLRRAEKVSLLAQESLKDAFQSIEQSPRRRGLTS